MEKLKVKNLKFKMTDKNTKLLIGAGIICAVLVLTGVALVSQAASNDHSQKPNIHKPVPAVDAVDVELIKKTTLRGKPAGKGKPSTNAATGILGATTGNKYAIVIGISDYPGTANDLKYADDDADEMYKALTTIYGYTPENIYLLKDMGANFSAVHDAIYNLQTKTGSSDEIVFFFSGHGGKGRASDGDKEAIDESIIVHDGDPNGTLLYIWDGQLKEWFNGFNTSRIVFIFDSCVAGGMTDLAATGRIINMATTETGTAYEFVDLENGQFTYYFVDEGMLQGLADLVGTPVVVTIEEAFDYSKAKSVLQTPTISDLFPYDLLL